MDDITDRQLAVEAVALKTRAMYEHARTDDDLALFIRLHLHFESAITSALDKVLNPGVFDWESPSAPEFLVRAKMALALGLLDRHGYNFAKKTATIRNEFAHRLERELAEQDFRILISQVSAECKEFVELSSSIGFESWFEKPSWRRGIVSMIWYYTLFVFTRRDFLEFIMEQMRSDANAGTFRH
jgi:hypothetical protein